MNRKRYPANWEAISLEIRSASSWTCQSCGKPCRKPGETPEQFCDRLYQNEIHDQWINQLYEEVTDDETGEVMETIKIGRFTLTVAHVNHDPANCDRENLIAECAPCHLKRDAQHHARNASHTRAIAKLSPGQLALFG
jgi:hypothetical protein